MFCALVLPLLLAVSGPSAFATSISASSYPFPYDDPLLASVTFALVQPSQDHMRKRSIVLKPDRKKVPILGEFAEFGYGVYVQKDRSAPVVLLLSGLGGSYAGGGNRYIAEVLYGAGFNVLSFDSNFFFTSILSASRDGYPGFLPDDAEDLYPILKQVLDDFRNRFNTGFGDVHIMGLSMGALESAFISKMDSEQKLLGIKKTLLLNPPVRLRYALSVLDQLFAVGDRWDYEFKERLMGYVIDKVIENAENPKAITNLKAIVQLGRPEIRYLIGRSFRTSLTSALLTSQQIDDRGILKGRYTEWHRSERTQEAFGYSFWQYVEQFLFPVLQKRHPEAGYRNVQEIFDRTDFREIESFAANNPDFYVMTNVDDLILSSKDSEYLESVLQERLLLFPYGGHCGNVWHPTNQARLIGILQRN